MAYEEISRKTTQASSYWQTATVSGNPATTGVINLEGPYEHALIIIPEDMVDATFAVHVSNDGTTFTVLYGLYLGTPGDIALPEQKATVVCIGGAQYLKVVGAGNQTAAKTIYVRGI